MITIFNRKLLYTTFSMAAQSRIRNILETNRIDYHIKVINRRSPFLGIGTRAITGTFGESFSEMYEYILYVHKNDYEKARRIISLPA